MRVMKVEVESTEGGATLRRAEGMVRAQWVTTAHGARQAEASARDQMQLVRLAKALQRALDGYQGTAGDVGDYNRIIQMLAD